LIKAVIFDLGRVIVPFDFSRVYAGLAPLCGTPAAGIRETVLQTDLIQQFERGEIEPREFLSTLSGLLRFETSYENFCSIWCSIFNPETLIQEELLSALARNYPLVLLSNTNAIHFQMIRENYPLLRQFHSFVLSHEVGAMKPSRLIYRRAIEAAGCPPEECFFTDDMPEYVEGARQMGIDAVKFESSAQIEDELRKRGVVWSSNDAAP
jgi:FMN phosphatase YigB (HAD superfamily)